MFTLDHVVPWGRSFDEYRRMFSLTGPELRLRIAGCGDGPASFNAEATRRGTDVVSFDPIYRWDASQIRGRIAVTCDQILDEMRRNAEGFVWDSIRSVEELGQVRMAAMEDFLEDIIGVVADAKARGAREAAKVETFIPYWQFLEPGIVVILKSANPGQLAAPLRAAVSSLDRNLPVSGVTTLSEMVGDSIAQPRFIATLAGAFAVLALILAAIGLYGVMAYAVSQRTTEIGVRMALGATPREVFRLVIADGLRLAAIGIALGAAGSLIMAQWLTAQLFGVQPGDPTTLAVTAAVLLCVSTLASFIPARRATRVDPMVAIRSL